MKQKVIDLCSHVNLNCDPKEILRTMQLELPTVDYFFKKANGGKHRMQQYEEQLQDKALAEEKSQVSEINEYISRKGNRWMSYIHVEYFPNSRFAQSWPTSFIYYETYGSCGAYFPLYQYEEKGDGARKIHGVIIFTSHFFQRLSERTGKPFRSRELIREFVTTMQTRSMQIDEEGDTIIKFIGGYGYGVKKSDEPMVVEIRTFLTDKQLSPSQKRKCEKVDAYAKMVEGGAFIKEAAAGMIFNDELNDEEISKMYEEKVKALKTLGLEKLSKLHSGLLFGFMRIFYEMLGKEAAVLDPKVAMATSLPVGDIFMELAVKYQHTDFREWGEEENRAFSEEYAECMAKAARKLGMKRVTTDIFLEKLEKYSKNR